MSNLKKAKLESENNIKSFCDTFTLQKHLLLKYLNHLRYLKIEQEKKKLKLRKKQNQQSLSEYDWEELIYSGKVRTNSRGIRRPLDVQ